MAERVSEEMVEPSLGETVGYQIRLEARRSAKTRLLFCTTGVILRRLQDDPMLKGVTHVCVDEVHERQYQVKDHILRDNMPFCFMRKISDLCSFSP